MTEPNTPPSPTLAVRQIRCQRLICGLRRPQRQHPPRRPKSARQ